MLALYMDHHVPRAITEGLRLRGIDVITAYEDGADDMEDSALLDRATELGRVLFTQDDDLLAEATKRQKEGVTFGGVIYSHQLQILKAARWRIKSHLANLSGMKMVLSFSSQPRQEVKESISRFAEFYSIMICLGILWRLNSVLAEFIDMAKQKPSKFTTSLQRKP